MREREGSAGATAKRLLLIVADGVRPDVMQEEIDGGRVPALASLAVRGGLHAISASFPSVTGAAYVPFLMGRHPAEVGLPGLRWFDRSRSLRRSRGSARSYSGIDIWQVDHDVARDAPTLLELATPSLAGMSMLGRGASLGNVGRGLSWMARAAIPHFRGDLRGWRRVELAATREFLRRFARARPRVSVLAITSPDKFAHAFGARSEAVRSAIGDVDRAVADARSVAAAGGWEDSLRIWVVGDHGHAPVAHHDDLHAWLESLGHRTVAHPRLRMRRPEVALMVGGNAMAHLYVEPASRARAWWREHASRWSGLHDALAERPSIDLVAVALDPHTVRVASAERGVAEIRRRNGAGTRWDYVAEGGDPLVLGGTLRGLDKCTAWQAAAASPYPDSVVQLAALATAPRSGDLIVSARAGWDLRARYETTPHVSTHGALLRDQMMVPLLLDSPATRTPLRTTDVVPSALQLLGVETAARFDGHSFV